MRVSLRPDKLWKKMGDQRLPFYRELSQSSSGTSVSSQSSTSAYVDVESMHQYDRVGPCPGRKHRGRHVKRGAFRRLCCAMTLAVILSSVSIVLSVANILFGEELRSLLKLTNKAEASQATELCLPCDYIKTSPDPSLLSPFRQQWREGTLECCASSAQQYKSLFDMIVSKKISGEEIRVAIEVENNRTLSTGGSGIPPYAHARIQSPGEGEDTRAPQVDLEVDGAQTSSSVVTILHDRLIIPRGGVYFVYSQIFFENNDPTTVHDIASQVLSHYVYRFNEDQPEDEMLLKGAQTQCWGRGKEMEKHTSYLAATLVLRPHDQLYVRASPQRFISRDPNSSFFGVVRLGDALHKSLMKRSP